MGCCSSKYGKIFDNTSFIPLEKICSRESGDLYLVNKKETHLIYTAKVIPIEKLTKLIDIDCASVNNYIQSVIYFLK